MNENLQTAVAQIIERSLVAVDTATTFLAAEIPDVVQQLLLWHMVKGVLYTVLGLAFLTAIPLYWKWWLRNAERDRDGDVKLERSSDFTGAMLGAIGSVVLLVLGMILINLTWLQIWIAPKVWLIEYAAALAK